MVEPGADSRKYDYQSQSTAFSIPPNTMNPDVVPAEVWQEIFSLLHHSADILSAMLTSKRFHMLAFRALHRTVVWRNLPDVDRSLPLWEEYPGMHLAVRRLECSVPGPISSSASRSADHGADGTTYDDSDCRHGGSQLTPSAYANMVSRMLSFKQLASLTFTRLQLGYRHFELIYNLPLLDVLRIEACGVQFGRFLTVFEPLTLPITHLTMRNLRRLYHDVYGEGTTGDNAYALLSLACAPNLHTLVIDRSVEVFKYVYTPAVGNGWVGFGPDQPTPLNLRRLYIERKHKSTCSRQLPRLPQPPVGGWPHLPAGANVWQPGNAPGALQAHAHGGDGFPEAALFAFLRRCPTLTTYATYHCAMQHAQLPQGVLPGLCEYAGPVGTLLGVVGGGRPIKALRLTNCTGPEAPERAAAGGAPLPPSAVSGRREGLPLLAAVANTLRDLRELDLEFEVWDDEIMHAVVRLFPELRALKITYEVGGPSETALVAMGPELLRRIMHLGTLRIYARPAVIETAGPDVEYDSDDEVESALRDPLCLFDDTFDTLEDELRELVIPWNRYCPLLREVQLTAEYRLLRGYEGGNWNLQRIRKSKAL